MDRTKENFRRILDWEKDPDQNHWRTINGSHVHLDKNGNYDGGAGNKFNGRHHYGPDWRQKASLMNRLHQALSQGAAKGAQRPNQGGAPSGNGGKIKTEEETIQDIDTLERSYKQIERKLSDIYYGPDRDKTPQEVITRLEGELKAARGKVTKAKIQAARDGIMITSPMKGKCGEKDIEGIKEKFRKAPEEIRVLWNIHGQTINQDLNHQPPGRANYNRYIGCVHVNMQEDSQGREISEPYQIFFHENGHAIDNRLSKSKTGYYSSEYNDGEFIKAIHEDVNKLVKDRELEIKEKIKAGDLKWLQDKKIIPKEISKQVFVGNKKEDIDPEMAKILGNELCNQLFGQWKVEWEPVTEIPEGFKFKKAMVYQTIADEMRAMDHRAVSDLCDILEGATKAKIRCVAGHGASYWKQRTYQGREWGLGTEAFAEFTDSHAANEKSRDILKKYLPKASEVYSRMIKEAVSRTEVN